MTTTTGYFTSGKITKKEYPTTVIDDRKQEADILLQSIDGNYYSLFLKTKINLPKKGVKVHSEKLISVTERVYGNLKKEYKIEMDF